MTVEAPPLPDPDGCDHQWTWLDRQGAFVCVKCWTVEEAE